MLLRCYALRCCYFGKTVHSSDKKNYKTDQYPGLSLLLDADGAFAGRESSIAFESDQHPAIDINRDQNEKLRSVLCYGRCGHAATSCIHPSPLRCRFYLNEY